jgi:hypothetical protein
MDNKILKGLLPWAINRMKWAIWRMLIILECLILIKKIMFRDPQPSIFKII